MAYRWAVLLLLLWISPSWAFVSKLVPHGGPINCEVLGAVMLVYGYGKVAPGFLGITPDAAQARNFLAKSFPIGVTWSATDTEDNNRLVTKIDGFTTISEVTAYGLTLQKLCSAQENDTFSLSQDQFLTILGIPRP